MKKICLIFLIMSSACCMENDIENPKEKYPEEIKGSPDANISFFEKYYNEEDKTLDLKNLALGDKLLEKKFKSLKKFINLTHVKNLILEKNNLVEIPYYLITFTLLNKNLKYLSLKYNKFNISLLQEKNVSVPISSIDSADFSDISNEIKNAISKNFSDNSETVFSNFASSIWEGISPEIEKAIDKSNSKDNKKFLYKKIIIIDKNIPPITIIDYEKLPKSTSTKIKKLMLKLGLVIIGLVISTLPRIVEEIIKYKKNSGSQGSNQ